MQHTSLVKKTILIAAFALFYSCDKDYNAIGDTLIGDNHFDLEASTYAVKAYNQKITPVATNNLAINALGIYENPAFGTTTANFNTQVSLTSYAPQLGEGVKIDSVTLNIPYFSHIIATNSDGSNTYKLDSIQGPNNAKLRLSVYESGVFMNNYVADDLNLSKFYYNDANALYQTQAEALGARLNDNSNSAENDSFFFNAKEIVQKTINSETKVETTTRIKPEMRLHLNKTFFQNKIFNAPSAALANSESFKAHFKGLYFKVEKSGASPTALASLDFTKGKITIWYTAKSSSTTATADETEAKTLDINLTGNSVNLLENSNEDTDYLSATTPDDVEDENLYLKGGQGSMAVIELSQFEEQLEEIRENATTKGWLVNEANLIFYINNEKMKGAPEPKRIYLYDLTNNTILLDYYSDASSDPAGNGKKNKYVFDGNITTVKNGETYTGVYYKVRITNHIRNLIKSSTAKNIKLGLVVTEDIGISTSNKLDKTQTSTNGIYDIPTASVMHPLGTILYGTSSATPAEKKLKLQIYYTKPN